MPSASPRYRNASHNRFFPLQLTAVPGERTCVCGGGGKTAGSEINRGTRTRAGGKKKLAFLRSP